MTWCLLTHQALGSALGSMGSLLRLPSRGSGGGSADSLEDSSSEDEDEPAVSELRQINLGGDSKVFQLPDGINFTVLAFGREEQTAARGDGARVVSVVLADARPTGQKKISSLQAEISAGEEGVNFMSLGQTFNFVNELPLHA